VQTQEAPRKSAPQAARAEAQRVAFTEAGVALFHLLRQLETALPRLSPLPVSNGRMALLRSLALRGPRNLSELARERGVNVAELGVTAERIADLAKLVDAGTVSATSAAAVGAHMLTSFDPPARIAETLGVVKVGDADQTAAWVDEAFAANAAAVQDAVDKPKKAKAAAGFLRGQVMRISGGKADPKLVGELIERRLAQLSAGH